MSSIPPVGPSNISPLGDSGSFSDTTFSQLGDAAWQAVQQAQSNPTALNIQTAIQCINNLNAYLQANPAPTSDPQYQAASDIQAALNTEVPGTGDTLADVCQNLDPGIAVSLIQGDLNSLFGSDSALYQGLDEIQTTGSVSLGDSQIQDDISQLQSDITAYNENYSNPDLEQTLLVNIANDIKKVNTDLSGSGVSDGYLTVLATYLNTPIYAAGSQSQTLLSFANNVLANNPPSQTDLDNLSFALASLGEQNSDGGSLLSMVNETLWEEFSQ